MSASFDPNIWEQSFQSTRSLKGCFHRSVVLDLRPNPELLDTSGFSAFPNHNYSIITLLSLKNLPVHPNIEKWYEWPSMPRKGRISSSAVTFVGRVYFCPFDTNNWQKCIQWETGIQNKYRMRSISPLRERKTLLAAFPSKILNL